MVTKVKVIGAGGIGLCLLPQLCRFLNYENKKFPEVEVSVIDGDAFEDKNRARQSFKNFGQKATQTANDLRDQFPRIVFYDHPVFVDEDNVVRFMRENDIVLSCVDNHKTRKILHDRAMELNNITVISGGNDQVDGDVITHIRRDGVDITSPIGCKVHHPSIASPNDLHPSEMNQPGSCSRQAAEVPQILLTNNLIAANMLGMFYNITDPVVYSDKVLKNPSMYHHVFIDMTLCKAVARERKVV